MNPEDTRRRLYWHGIFLFLLGLLTGFVVQSLRNPRMGLTAHLEGVMNGTFLAVLGALWPRLRLTPRAAAVAFWLALYGSYANWASTLLAAAFGTGALAPIAAAGRHALPWQEGLVTFGLVSLSIADITCCLILLRGLRGRASVIE